jgi:hypothetical protein
METSPLVKNSFKGKRNEREKIPFNGFPDSRYPITGGPIATYDMNGVLQPGYADKPSIEGCRYATTVAEGAALGEAEPATNLSTYWVDNGDGTYSIDGSQTTWTLLYFGGISSGVRFTYDLEVISSTASLQLKTNDIDVQISSGNSYIGEAVAGATKAAIQAGAGISATVRPIIREVIPQYLPTVGPELVTNGDFSDGATGWSLSGNWSVSGGVAVSDGSSSYHCIQDKLTIGKSYLVTFEVKSLVSGTGYRPLVGVSGVGTTRTTVGTFSECIKCTGDTKLYISAVGNAVGSIDNVSVREVPANYAPWKEKLGEELFTGNLTTGDGINIAGEDTTHIVTFSENGMRYQSDTTSPILHAVPVVTFTLGKRYRIVINVANKLSGSIKADTFGAASVVLDSVGTKTFEGTATQTNIDFYRMTSNVDITINSLSIRQILPDYTTDDTTSLFPFETIRGQKQYTDYEYKYFPARTNLLTYSQDFDNEAWIKRRSTIASNVITAPDGTATASKVIPDNGVSGYIYRMCSLTASQENTESIYVKAAGVNYIKYNTRLYDETYSSFGINLQTAEVTNIFPNNVVCTAEKVGGNGWIRIKLTGTSSATGNRNLFYITPTDADFSLLQGDGSSGVGLWAGQLEAGSEASWYIPTTSATITKPAGVYSRLNPLAFKRTALWGASTNKVTCRKANPTDTTNISVLSGDGSVSLYAETEANLKDAVDENGEAVDLTKICTSFNVYKLTAGTLDTTFVFGGNVGNTNPHSGAAYIRDGDEDNPALFYIGYTSSGFIYNSTSKYHRATLENITNGVTSVGLRVKMLAGKTCYVILPQLEESPYCTPPIFKASDGTDPLTSLTRPATLCEAGSAGILRGNNIALMGQVISGTSGNSGYILGCDIDSSNRVNIYKGATNIQLVKVVGGISGVCMSSHTHLKNTSFQWQAYLSSSYGMGIRVRYWLGLAWSTWTSWATNADTQDAPIAETFQIGSRNGAYHFAGNYQMFRTYWSADPKAWLESQG